MRLLLEILLVLLDYGKTVERRNLQMALVYMRRDNILWPPYDSNHANQIMVTLPT